MFWWLHPSARIPCYLHTLWGMLYLLSIPRNPLRAAVTVWLASLCCAVLCCAYMCVVVCAYIQAYMAICVCALYMCTELTVWLDFGACAWYMHLELYTVVLLGSDVTVNIIISHLHFHLLIWIGVMESGSWCLVTWDKVHFSFVLSPYQALATTCKPAGSG